MTWIRLLIIEIESIKVPSRLQIILFFNSSRWIILFIRKSAQNLFIEIWISMNKIFFYSCQWIKNNFRPGRAEKFLMFWDAIRLMKCAFMVQKRNHNAQNFGACGGLNENDVKTFEIEFKFFIFRNSIFYSLKLKKRWLFFFHRLTIDE